jgi:hypothetical protein
MDTSSRRPFDLIGNRTTGTRLTPYICDSCATQYPRSLWPPAECTICADERLGQRGAWTTPTELEITHEARIAELELGLLGVSLEPTFANGQRALIVDGVLFDCLPLVNDDLAAAAAAYGGIRHIAVSHPHCFGAAVDWAVACDAEILVHERDSDFVVRPSPRIRYWSGKRLRLTADVELVHVGGHFPGAAVCHWQAGGEGGGALLTSDVIHLTADGTSAAFMWSHTRFLPLAARAVERIVAVLADLHFDAVYGSWWDRDRRHAGKALLVESATRHLRALAAP